MKIVFFRQLLLDECTCTWTPSQQIVYSHLLSQSILKLDGVFGESGASIDYVEVIERRNEHGQIDLSYYNIQQLSKLLNLSRQKVYDCIEFLKLHNFITDDSIYCPSEIIYHGYFELKVQSGLTKRLLIFYSWLYDIAQFHYGIIDAFSYRMAEMFGTNEINIRVMLSRLSKEGLVKRVMAKDKRYGKLLIK